jgi:NADH dehydrogenase FAD-containing subunit
MAQEANGRPEVVILGGGFGGLAAARALKRAAVRVTLIDRRNYHLFQPLLYQVAPPRSIRATSPTRSGAFCAASAMRG